MACPAAVDLDRDLGQGPSLRARKDLDPLCGPLEEFAIGSRQPVQGAVELRRLDDEFFAH